MAEERYNRKNPAVKRILQEVKEMQTNPSDDFMSLPLEENIFEWQFAVRGPRDSEFEGGIYHGRIQLPAEYPFKPPSFMLLTPNGRFETQTKICLSISNYHPEHWQPSWSVRTALVALIAFMPTNPDGALGSLDYKKEERRKLAIKSREAAPKYGSPERQNLIDEIHQYMLTKAPPVPELPLAPATDELTNVPTNNVVNEDPQDTPNAMTANLNRDEVASAEGHLNPETDQGMQVNVPEVQLNAAAGPQRMPRVRQAAESQTAATDRLLTRAAIGLTIAIIALLLKKFLKTNGIFPATSDL
ncbi:ubiquitin-conjugating enzyme E2 J1 protein [Dioscorea alata]|uniref:Ubiquitin-conjugating enzyme E2 J1 protein n=1 Tax=Dioscorea alata TaxID=55571 RepID=A0ACB7VPP3_DIOAL|nr:ubiquitin-conjugating enzyme E2 J1 protein [Dioscorea alata]